MRILLGLLGVYIVLIFCGQIAMAMGNNSQQTPVAQMQSSWDVEEFTRDNGFPTGECVMRAKYDNNIEITFKGKNGQLSALRVRDINGGAGSPVKGFLSLTLAKNSYGLQSRSAPGQIDASLLTVPGTAEKIMDLNVFGIRVSGQSHQFSADGFAYAYHDLLKCTGYESAKTLKVVSQSRRRAAPMIVANPDQAPITIPTLPAEPVDLVVEQDLIEPKIFEVDPTPIDIKPEVIEAPEERPEMRAWNAYKGDKLSIVLADWSRQANVMPNIDLVEEITLQKDIKVFGPLDIAVGQLLKDVYGDNVPMATLKEAQGEMTNITTPNKSFATPEKKFEAIQKTSNWNALQGMDLRKLLKRWSVREGIDFVWNVDQTFLLKETTKLETDYNGAVASVLDQYSDQNVKPLGTLNVDPETGQKTLMISVSGAS